MGYFQMTRNVEEIFGGVVVAPHQIPFKYTSTNGGETFLSLPFYPITGFVTINGGVQVPLDNFEIDGNTLNLGRELDPGDVVFCLFDKIMSPQDASNSAVRIYKFLSVGGETEFTPDFTTYSVQSLYIDGKYKTPGEDYNYFKTSGKVVLDTTLPTGVWVVAEMSIKQNIPALAGNDGASNIGTLAGITVEKALTNNDRNNREHWRRQLEDVGLTLVDGSFEEGATVQSATDAVWHITGGKCYTWAGTLPKTVEANSTPLGDESAGWVSVTLLLSSKLTSANGGNLIRVDNAELEDIAEVSILRFMTPADINTILNTSGAEVAVDYALQSVIDAGYKSVRFPHNVKGIYTLDGSVTLPGAFTIYGECSKPYTVSGDSSFVGKGTVIRKALGADYIFGPGSTFRIYGCIFDGRDKARPFINNTNQLRGGILYNCGLYRFLYGVGSYGYTSIQVGRSSICANTIGIRNLIDSKIIDVTINTQSSHAVDLQTGANNNIFVNVRNEWNDGVGYNIYGSVGNIITGELVDRNGSANFAIRNGGGAIIGNLFSQRPGRLSAEGALYNTHFYIEGSGSYLMLSNVKTTKGVDDGGTGILTPERVITTGGTATDMTVQATGCDLTGYTVSALRESITIDNKLFRNNLGVSDTVTTGLYQMTTGRQNIGGAKTNQVLSSGAGSTLTLTFSHPALVDPSSNPTPRPKRRTILIESNTSAGVVSTYEIGILIRRVSANAAVATLSGKEFSSPTGVWGVSGATGVTVAVSVNADASTVTVQLTNVDGVGRFVDATLLPQ